MAQRRISAAIVERKGKLAGILTATDVALALSRTLRELAVENPSDNTYSSGAINYLLDTAPAYGQSEARLGDLRSHAMRSRPIWLSPCSR